MKDTRILIVEDEVVVARNLGVTLKRLGYAVSTVSSWEDAIQRAVQAPPDLVLMDIRLEGETDGIEAAKQIQARLDVPVVYLTAHAGEETLQRARIAAPFGYVLKPFKADGLHSAIEMALYKHGMDVRLRDQEEIYRCLAERASDGIAIVQDSKLLYANPRLAEMLGNPTEEIIGTLFTDYIHPDELPQVIERSQRHTAGGEVPSAYETVLKRRDGHEIYVEVNAGITTCQGKPASLVIIRDITGRKRVEEALRKAYDDLERRVAERTVELSRANTLLREEIAERRKVEEELTQTVGQLRALTKGLEEAVMQRTRELQTERDRTQAILEAVGESVVVTDIQGLILYANPATSVLTGFTREEVLGRDMRTWLCERNIDEIWGEMLQVLRVGRMWRGEMACRRQDGTRYDAATIVAPLFDPDDAGRLIGSVWAQRDITPFKEAEALKDQFISNVSHELRTPLSIVALTSDNLDAFYERLEEVARREMIRDIREQARLLNDLVDDILEISRIDSGRISLERAPVDLAQLVREEMDKQRPLAQKKHQSLRITGAESLVTWANEGQLRQVIRNLLNNAIKYTPDGGRITCECLRQSADAGAKADQLGGVDGLIGIPLAGPLVAVRVIDNGPGVDQQDLPRLFERFYRAEPEGNVPGTGLGLSIAQELVKLHGGSIVVSSPPGEGCTFTVYLPLLEE